VAAERRVKPGDLVTDRFGHGVVLVQNLYTPRSRDTRLRAGEVALVTCVGLVKDSYTGREVCDVLFKGEVWRADTIQLRAVKDG
jgi:hypothetical protein